jgi:hypothetical protein
MLMMTFTPKSKTETQQARHYPISRQPESATEGINNRPEAIALRKLQGTMNRSFRVQTLAQLQDTIHNSPRQVAQRRELASMFSHPVKSFPNPARAPQVADPDHSSVSTNDNFSLAAQMQTRADSSVRGAAAARLQRLADNSTDARNALQRVTAMSRQVIQRFKLQKWHVREQSRLVELLGGNGPWDTDSLRPETKRELYTLLSEDSRFSSERTTELELLKKSLESPEQPSVAKGGLPQIRSEVKKTGVSTPHVHNPGALETSPPVARPSSRTTHETSTTRLTPQEALPRKPLPDQDKTARRPLPSPPRSVTTSDKMPTALTAPDLSPERQTGLQESSPGTLEAIEPVNDVPHNKRVERAMATIPTGTETSEDTVMTALITEYGSAQALVEPSKTPEFASALLESIRLRQSPGWASATEMVKPHSKMGLPGKVEDWTIRHYTNKATVTLADPSDNGLRKVLAVDTPPFNELLSMVTLTAMRMHGMGNYPLNLGQNQKLHTNSSSKTSGHTSALDWKNIGNIGDTFYALFYKGKSATGVVPAFITDALYYAEWRISDFGEGWASSDWLSTASGSKEEGTKRPSGKAVEGPLEQVIAHQLGKLKFQARAMEEATAVESSTASTLTANFENFEVKKHGSVKLQNGSWKPANPGKIGEIHSGWYDANDNWTKG